MKIIHVSTQMSWGGGEKQILYLMTELQKKGVEQILVCAQNSALAKKSKDAGLETLELKKKFFHTITWGLELATLVKQNRDTILHAHDGKAHNCVFTQAILNSKTPIIVHRRLVKNKHGFYNRWKFNHSSIRKIVCISSAVQKSLEPIVKDSSKLVLIPSGIKITSKNTHILSHEAIKSELGLPKESRLILNIGSLLPQKHQLFFLKIAKAFFQKHPQRQDDVFFAIMGEGPQKDVLETFISENSLSKNCFMLGFLKNAQEILSASDILISTSIDEALGNVVMEAFLVGVPVIASNSGGVRDLISDRETGFLAEALNEDNFLTACETVLSDTELGMKIRTAAFKKLEDFDVVKTADSMYKLYRSIQAIH